MADYNTISNDSKEMAYDLRQIYAKLVGEHLNDIAESRKADRYNIYFDNLDDLHTIVKHKFKKKDKDEEAYKKLVREVAELANNTEHTGTWSGQSNNPKSAAILNNKLKEIEMFLYERMEEANMFGQKFSDEDDDL